MKSEWVLKDFNRDRGRSQREMFAPTPSTLSLKTMLAVSSHGRNNHSESDYIAIAIDVHTAFLHADIDQELFAEPPEESEEEDWKLQNSLYRKRKARKLTHPHVLLLLESQNYHPLLTDPSGFRDDELDINVFLHVDDGLLIGPSIEILRSIEFLSKQVMMRAVGRLARLGDPIFLLGRVIVRTTRGYSFEVNPKYIRDVMAVLRLEDSRPVATLSFKRTLTTESPVELENEKTNRVQDSRGKTVAHVPRAC